MMRVNFVDVCVVSVVVLVVLKTTIEYRKIRLIVNF